MTTTLQNGISKERTQELVALAKDLAAKHFQELVAIEVIDEEDGDSGGAFTEVKVTTTTQPKEVFADYFKFLNDWTPQLDKEELKKVRLRYTTA